MAASYLNPMSSVLSMIPKIQPYNPMSAVTSMIPKIQPFNPLSVPAIQTAKPANIVSMTVPGPAPRTVNTPTTSTNYNYNYIKPGATVFGPPLLANTNFGLNPGFIQAVPAYQTTSPTQNQYDWGPKPFQAGPTFNSQLAKQVSVSGPVAPTAIKTTTTKVATTSPAVVKR